MIWELWQYLNTSSALPYVKPIGFLKESVATAARAKRCHNAWQPHYEACRSTILECLTHCSKKRTAVVFGAGTLADIPLKTLSWHFQNVVLVDVVFLPAARKLARAYPNVSLMEHDVTESLASFYHCHPKIGAPQKWLDNAQIDLVVSLNLATQLPLLPVKWLREQCQLRDDEADQIGQQLMAEHVNYLKNFYRSGVHVCLIADRWVKRLNRVGEELEGFDPWWEVEKPKSDKQWEWQLMPLGEGSRHYSQVHEVGVSYLKAGTN